MRRGVAAQLQIRRVDPSPTPPGGLKERERHSGRFCDNILYIQSVGGSFTSTIAFFPVRLNLAGLMTCNNCRLASTVDTDIDQSPS